jgi:hypothetical protein
MAKPVTAKFKSGPLRVETGYLKYPILLQTHP